jgi:tetratricopeptide (TPR) repeat protein
MGSGGTRAEAVVGTPEVIDGAEPHPAAAERGDYLHLPALDARVSTMPDFPGLGPPDIVYVRKRFRPSVYGPSKTYGYYHFIRGADVSSPAALAAYIYQLLNAGLDPAPWLTTGSWEIVGASVHSYNAIQGRDAVVEITLPGGVTASSMGPDAALAPATGDGDYHEPFWKETAVCAVARAISNTGELPLYPCLRAIAPLPTPEAEDRFLDLAAATLKRWHRAGTDRPGVDIATTANSRIAVAISDYFLADARYARAQAFFDSDQVLVADPETGAHAAHAANRAGDYDAADRIVSTVIELNPKAAQAWLARAETRVAQGQFSSALDAALKATECAPDDLIAWIAVAKIYSSQGDHESALVALNSADMPPPPLDPFLRQLVPNRRNLTQPLRGGDVARSGAVRTLATRLREERNMSTSKADEMLAELPAKLMTQTERDVYAVLVSILSQVGWDSLLSIRGRCFVMESDIAAARAEEDDIDDIDRDPDELNGQSLSPPPSDAAPPPGGPPSDLTQTTSPTTNGDVAIDVTGANLAAVSLSDSSPAVMGASSATNGDSKSESYKTTHLQANGHDTARAANESDNDASDTDDEAEGLPISQRALEDIGKKVCKPWLDYLVTNLYEDLRAMAVWNAEEQLHLNAAEPSSMDPNASSGQAAAAALRAQVANGDAVVEGGAIGDVEDIEQGIVDGLTPIRNAEEIELTTRRPPVDWLRRGELALRLGKTEDAKTAFWVCCRLSEKAKIPAVTALINIMSIAASEGDASPALRCSDALWSYVDVATERQATQKTLDAYSEPAPVMRNAIHTLISKVGLNKVRASMPSRMDVNHSRLEGLLLDAVAWKVHGYDK